MEMASATHYSQRGSQRINSTKTAESSLASQKYSLDINAFLRRKPPRENGRFRYHPRLLRLRYVCLIAPYILEELAPETGWTYGRAAATGRHRQIAYGVLASDRQKMADSDNLGHVTLAFFDDCEHLL
jgi:hypothetical protein